MRKKVISVALACLLASSLVMGCVANTKVLEEIPYGERSDVSVKAAAGANDFAFKLSSVLAQQNGNNNFVFSPFVVWLSLTSLVGATQPDSKEKLLDSLGVSGIGEEDIHQTAYRMLYDITKQADKKYVERNKLPYHDPLKIANAVFVDNDVTLKKNFAEDFARYYDGSSMNVNFDKQRAVDAVNKWAGLHTQGMITDLVNEFDPETAVAIASAVYFADKWKSEFDSAKTVEDIFHAPIGDTLAFYMERIGDNLTYYEDDKVQAMPLDFKTGGGLYIILPKDGNATELLGSMTSEYYEEIRRDAIKATGKLLLPRFSVESDVKALKYALETLGVPLFDKAAAPLTGGLIEEQKPVWLPSAIQKAMIVVDEEGTTALAVNIMEAPGAPMPVPTEPFEMNCNKPFIFLLYGYTNDGGNQILFTGIVNRP